MAANRTMIEQSDETENSSDKRLAEPVREKLSAVLAENQYMQMLHMELLDLELGYAKARMQVAEDVLNPYGSVHGGCLYSLADVIAGLAACTYGSYVSTISGTMNYIRPAMHTAYVYCEAVKIRQGRKVSFYQVKLTDDTGKILEEGNFNFYNLEEKVE